MTSSSSLQAGFDEALNLIAQKKLPEAIQKLQSLRDEGLTSADLEANLGHALVENGQTGPGISHLMDAVALDRFDLPLRHDLEFAQSKVENGWGTSMSHPAEFASDISSFLRPTECYAVASLFLLAIFFGRLYGFLRRAHTISLAILAVLFVATGLFTLSSYSLAVVKEDTDLRSAPIESAEVTNPLKSGTRVRIIRKSGGFAEVERANAFRGWMSAAALKNSPY